MDFDIYYRAFAAYRKFTKEERDCEAVRRTLSNADTANDMIEIVKTNCIIETDWIEAIEKGLEHVQKAIAEERQFIRSNGEVIPIEKVRSVSKDSVDHLARHSNLLTRKPEDGKDIVPDQLYTVERLSDYTVYENRFLYMMLCFLRDFIAFRYEKIIELTNTYNGKLQIKKNAYRGGRNISVDLKLSEEIKNDEYLSAHNPVKDKIDRIDLIYKSVLVLLNTPLMEEVAKAPMLKPPITETNVLRMNKNFKGAKELYYYISSYDKPGYTVEQKTETLSPFRDEISDEVAEIVTLSSFLAYEHGLGIEDVFKANFEKYEKAQKEEERRKRDELLKTLKRKAKQTGMTEPEYLLYLEEKNKELSADSLKLVEVEEELTKTKDKATTLGEKVEEQGKKIEELTEKYETDMKASVEYAASEIARVNTQREEELSAQAEKYNEELTRITNEYNEKIKSQWEEYKKLLFEAELEKNEKLANYNSLLAKLDTTLEEKRLVEARLISLLTEQGQTLPEHDFSTAESFDEIEQQYKAFKKYFNKKWKSAKKQIRKEALSSENIKKMSEKKYKYEPDDEELELDEVLGKPKPQKYEEKEKDDPALLDSGEEVKAIPEDTEVPDTISDDNPEVTDTENKDE